MRQRVEGRDFRICRERVIDFLHRLLPAPDAQPVIVRRRVEKESFGRGDEELFALSR